SGKGAEAARKLEDVLNSAPHFTVLDLSQNPEGSSSNQTGSAAQHVTTLNRNGATYGLDLERVTLPNGGPTVWLFSPETVASVLRLNLSTSAPGWVRFLPKFMTSAAFLETPLWIWLGLLIAAALLLSLARLLDHLLVPCARTTSRRLLPHLDPNWTEAV